MRWRGSACASRWSALGAVEHTDHDRVHGIHVARVGQRGASTRDDVPLRRLPVLHPDHDLARGCQLGPQGEVAGDDADLVGHYPAGPGGDISAAVVFGHVPHISLRAVFSAVVTVSRQECFTSIQSCAYSHQISRLGGRHCAGSWSPFARFVDAETARSCGRTRSLAKSPRFWSFHSSAPERHALASGTMWSMSTCNGSVNVLPSYTLNQRPPVTLHPSLTVMSSPSRRSTVSRTSQLEPPSDRQCGNRSRL